MVGLRLAQSDVSLLGQVVIKNPLLVEVVINLTNILDLISYGNG